MKVKNYLLQLKRLEIQIQQLQHEKEFLESQLTSKSIAPKEIQVISSAPMDPMGERIARIVDLEHQVDEKTDILIAYRQKIVSQIQMLDDPLQMKILYKRYVEYLPWEKIEEDTNYSFQHLQRIHKKALRAFEYQNQNEIR